VLIGFLLALGCSVCYGTASVFQAVATRSVEGGSGSGVDAMLLMRAVRQWRYLVGIGLDGLGFLLQVMALRMVPIYVVAAALAASIAVTGIVSAWVLSARLSTAEWTAVGVVCVSLAVLACAVGTAPLMTQTPLAGTPRGHHVELTVLADTGKTVVVKILDPKIFERRPQGIPRQADRD